MLAVIGGTGFYDSSGWEVLRKKRVHTPFGKPSAPIWLLKAQGTPFLFLSRHGKAHKLLPHEINYRANIFALKMLGARRVVSFSALGSLRESIAPGDFVVPVQYIDWTGGQRKATFLGKGLNAHISTANPACPRLAAGMVAAARHFGARIHDGAVYVCVNGPRLSTCSESKMLQKWGGDVIGMTNLPEAFLAREAQLCYTCLGIVTDYDCWRDGAAASLGEILGLHRRKAGEARALFEFFLKQGCPPLKHSCRSALKDGFFGDLRSLSTKRKRIFFILGA